MYICIHKFDAHMHYNLTCIYLSIYIYIYTYTHRLMYIPIAYCPIPTCHCLGYLAACTSPQLRRPTWATAAAVGPGGGKGIDWGGDSSGY